MIALGLEQLLTATSAVSGPVAGDERLYYAAPGDLCFLTAADRELIEVVTGEIIPEAPRGLGVRVSFFTLQIVLDRLDGALRGGEEVTIDYLEAVHTAYEMLCPHAGTPVSGDLLDLGLAWLVGKQIAREDRELTF